MSVSICAASRPAASAASRTAAMLSSKSASDEPPRMASMMASTNSAVASGDSGATVLASAPVSGASLARSAPAASASLLGSPRVSGEAVASPAPRPLTPLAEPPLLRPSSWAFVPLKVFRSTGVLMPGTTPVLERCQNSGSFQPPGTSVGGWSW